MNAVLSTGVFALLAAALAPPLDAHNGSVAIAVPLKGIAVDGDLSDWPPGLVEYPITFPEWGDAPVNEEDFQGVFRVGYSAGSFSWIAWGRGVNKSGHPDSYERLGDLVLVTEGAMAPVPSPDPRPEVVVAGADRLAEAMEGGDAGRVRQLVGEGGWYTLRGKSGELFNGFSLGNWWPLSDQWGVEDGQIVCPTSDRIHFLISEYVFGEPFQLRYEVAALDRSPGTARWSGSSMRPATTSWSPSTTTSRHTIQIDSGRKVFDASGVRGPWKMETSAGLQMKVGKWYEVVCTVDGTNFTVSTGDVELQHPFEPQFPVFIWLEVQRTGARFRGLHISKL